MSQGKEGSRANGAIENVPSKDRQAAMEVDGRLDGSGVQEFADVCFIRVAIDFRRSTLTLTVVDAVACLVALIRILPELSLDDGQFPRLAEEMRRRPFDIVWDLFEWTMVSTVSTYSCIANIAKSLTSAVDNEAQHVVHLEVNSPEEVKSLPKTPWEKTLACSLCHECIDICTTYFKLECAFACRLLLHKECLTKGMAAQGLRRKKEYKESECLTEACHGSIKHIFDVGVDGRESLYLKSRTTICKPESPKSAPKRYRTDSNGDKKTDRSKTFPKPEIDDEKCKLVAKPDFKRTNLPKKRTTCPEIQNGCIPSNDRKSSNHVEQASNMTALLEDDKDKATSSGRLPLNPDAAGLELVSIKKSDKPKYNLIYDKSPKDMNPPISTSLPVCQFPIVTKLVSEKPPSRQRPTKRHEEKEKTKQKASAQNQPTDQNPQTTCAPDLFRNIVATCLLGEPPCDELKRLEAAFLGGQQLNNVKSVTVGRAEVAVETRPIAKTNHGLVRLTIDDGLCSPRILKSNRVDNLFRFPPPVSPRDIYGGFKLNDTFYTRWSTAETSPPIFWDHQPIATNLLPAHQHSVRLRIHFQG